MDLPIDAVLPDSYKRAVYRPPPSQFVIEMLGAVKQGGSYSYGLRISPVASPKDRSSISPDSEYEIWRRWEDCLVLQDTLEVEYRQRARVKRQRLLRGKGVKRNGFYIQDQASSWESLPPGPNPNSVARDIHEYLPTLTKKATVFRASQATIDQRTAELKAFVQGLLKDDLPALVDELRNDRSVTDFFGYWRRDYELAQKERKQRTNSSSQRNSMSSSIFSTYFSSNSSVRKLDSAAGSTSPRRRAPSGVNPIPESPRTRESSPDSSDGSAVSFGRRRAYSTGSSTGSHSTPSDVSLDSPVHIPMSVPDVADDVPPVTFNYDPHSWSGSHVDERPSYALATLPEDGEISLKEDVGCSPIIRRGRKNSGGDPNPDRYGVIFPTSLTEERERMSSLNRNVRESWQTIDSAACFLEDIHITMPTSPTNYSHRESTSSIATFQTNCSVEGVLPRSPFEPSPVPRRRVPPTTSRIVSCPISITEFDDEWSEPEEDILDACLADSFPPPSFDICEDIIQKDCLRTPLQFSDEERTILFPPTPSPSTFTSFSISSQSSDPEQLTIKAGYNDSFIVLRVSCEISYKDLRQQLYTKFVGLEGIPLSDKFTIFFVQPITFEISLNTSTADPESTTLYPVVSEGDWENVVASLEKHKLALRVFDPTS